MFNNLIESTSHVKEFKRRGSFVLVTTITYGVLLAIAGVASVYAYDAHLDSQSTELEITFMPIVPEAPQPVPPRTPVARPPSGNERAATHPERTDFYDSTSNPNNPPDNISTAAHSIPPAPPNAIRSYRNVDPDPGAIGRPGATGVSTNTPQVDIGAPPPPPEPKPVQQPPKVLKVSTGVLTSKLVSLPKPSYPPLAKQLRLQGAISVQVLIDETGKVVSAKAVAGHQILVNAAEGAAMQARFTPTLLSNQPVKVSGIIIYNFQLP